MKTCALSITGISGLNLVVLYFAAMFLFIGASDVMAVEEAKYEVIKQDGQFEVRDYSPHILAETVIEENFEDAGDKAFNRLFRYIAGDNKSRIEVPMTAPVSQESRNEKIEMTAPVGLQRAEQGWAVSFMMPATYTLETLPLPDDPSERSIIKGRYHYDGNDFARLESGKENASDALLSHINIMRIYKTL